LSKSGAGVFTMARGLLVPGNIRILALASMLTGTYVSMLNTILQPFVVNFLGLNVAVLGTLVAVGARPSGLASSIIQPVAGRLADVLGRKRLIILGSAVGVGSMISFLIAAATLSFVPLSVGYFLFGLSLLGNPASQAMTAETVAMDPVRVNVAFGVVYFFTSLPGAIVPFFVGYIGYAVIFGVAALLETINLLVLFPQLRETRQPADQGEVRPLPRFSLKETIRLPAGFIRIFVPFAMDAFSWGIGGAIIYGMWTDYFKFTNEDIGLIYGTFCVSIVATQYFATRLLVTVGPRKTLAFSEFLTVVVLLGWLLSPHLIPLIGFAVVFGVSVATWVPALSSLLMAAAPVEERGSIGGKLAAFRGLAGAPAPILGGLIYGALGYYVPVFLSLTGESVTVLAILWLLPKSPASPGA
jgi:MFS family permease